MILAQTKSGEALPAPSPPNAVLSQRVAWKTEVSGLQFCVLVQSLIASPLRYMNQQELEIVVFNKNSLKSLQTLAGKRVLVVEDEHYAAIELPPSNVKANNRKCQASRPHAVRD
ncbi:hypothetical protein [Rhizobium sp. S163]|uniref:hypothetical protein n=1 Tax=Rhizobium sp. S163 TaxID=3055039 RepID=UPI0025A9B711|nr:hypothetical protein [Rhizobium sp. S163]